MKNSTLSVQQIIDKFGETPQCYLTGKNIDIYRTDTYHFDHIIPISRGGDNTINNLQIASADVNLAKRNMTPQEFLIMCQQVVNHYGKIKLKQEL